MSATSCEEQDRQTLATYCNISVDDIEDVSQMRGEGTDHPRYAIAVHHETKAIVIAIRGTASLSDGLVHDLMAHDVPFLSGVAHSGFAAAALAMKTAVILSITSLKIRFPNYKLVCCGHSLGAGAKC